MTSCAQFLKALSIGTEVTEGREALPSGLAQTFICNVSWLRTTAVASRVCHGLQLTPGFAFWTLLPLVSISPCGLPALGISWLLTWRFCYFILCCPMSVKLSHLERNYFSFENFFSPTFLTGRREGWGCCEPSFVISSVSRSRWLRSNFPFWLWHT